MFYYYYYYWKIRIFTTSLTQYKVNFEIPIIVYIFGILFVKTAVCKIYGEKIPDAGDNWV
jgi:hypothetical protein